MFNVLWHFFVLGLYSFGGPAAHIGYFHREFVQKLKWLKEEDFTHAVALCQFLPGPASSQLGMYVGYKKAGYAGALAAFMGFTFPSFVLLTFFAMANHKFNNVEYVNTFIQAAKLLAVVVVADALLGMTKKLITDKQTIIVALLTAIWAFFSMGLIGQIIPILLAALVGFMMSFISAKNSLRGIKNESIRPNILILGIFLFFLLGMPLLTTDSPLAAIFNVFYQAGSFVFGGGHVVLPLLQPMLEDMVEPDTFIAAYASAQLVPGPMFTMASYLGAAALGTAPIMGSAIATIAVFMPGSLLLFAFLPAWKALFSHSRLTVAIKLVNACVVGLLASAFVKPVMTTSIGSPADMAAVTVGYGLIKYGRCPVWLLAIMLFFYKLFI
ncbi:chromate efflux transporter [Photobacterium sp.]|uniref:chromate efflux transporter n=1 Tax=Photobacterium sp. TaxID=660 RepID=UPI00299E9036|nr:chromate efflux transporter [Photobacterium sp.]MDX1302818.1 chromate efflux transporter [Photobacterium sp.]